ncbi:unnamed protein product [Urochloa humidicola]
MEYLALLNQLKLCRQQTYRSGEVLLPGHKNKRQVYFGEGRLIKVGDLVYVMQSLC